MNEFSNYFISMEIFSSFDIELIWNRKGIWSDAYNSWCYGWFINIAEKSACRRLETEFCVAHQFADWLSGWSQVGWCFRWRSILPRFCSFRLANLASASTTFIDESIAGVSQHIAKIGSLWIFHFGLTESAKNKYVATHRHSIKKKWYQIKCARARSIYA